MIQCVFIINTQSFTFQNIEANYNNDAANDQELYVSRV